MEAFRYRSSLHIRNPKHVINPAKISYYYYIIKRIDIRGNYFMHMEFVLQSLSAIQTSSDAELKTARKSVSRIALNVTSGQTAKMAKTR